MIQFAGPTGDLATEVGKLKALPGRDLQIYGASLAQSLSKLGLIDESGNLVQ